MQKFCRIKKSINYEGKSFMAQIPDHKNESFDAAF